METIRISESDSISLDFKPYNLKLTLSNLDLENIDDGDLSKENLLLKTALGFDKQLLPDDVFQQNRLIERKKQEKVLLKILSNISLFVGIENVSVEKFLNEGYFESILKIWAEIGEITPNQIKAIKYFSIQYAKNGYRGVLEYQFKRYSEKTDIHDFVNKSYHQVFKNVKDTIEYQLPRVFHYLSR